MNGLTFARNLVKGKIAETIFAQMLRETQTFTVLEFGYEKVIPELIQQTRDHNTGIIDMLRAAPDFAVINLETKKVHLVEVKYMHVLNQQYVLEDAQRMAESWNPSFLFVATLDGFYFDEASAVIENNGDIPPLHHDHIATDIQARYLQILVDFEGRN